MPGVTMVIGSHNNTIFLRRASQFCTVLDTKEETVSRLVQRSFRRICALPRNKIISKLVLNKALASGACLAQIWLRFALIGKCEKKAVRAALQPQKRARKEKKIRNYLCRSRSPSFS